MKWIILGAIAGWIASIIMKKNDKMGALSNIAVGIIGAFIGGKIGTSLFNVDVSGVNLPSIALSVLGSVILLAFLGAIKKK